MKLKNLVLKNFKSFKNAIIDFTNDSSEKEKNIMLIWWFNWSWKTSILEAINICLYGTNNKDIFDKNKDISDFVNRKSLKELNTIMQLSLEIETDDWNNIIIQRNWSSINTEKEISHNNIQSSLSIIENWKIKKTIDENKWDEYINTIIPKWVSQFFFFDWEKIQNVADDNSPNRLRNDIDEILWLEKIVRLLKHLKTIKNNFQREKINITNNKEDIENKTLDLERKNIIINNKTIQIIELEEIIWKENQKLKELNKERDNLFWSKIESGNKSAELQKELLSIKNQIKENENKIKEYCSDVLPFLLLASLFPKLEKNLEISKEKRRINNINIINEWLINNIINELYKPNALISNLPWDDNYYELLKENISNAINKFTNISYDNNEKLILDIDEFTENKIKDIIRIIKWKWDIEFLPLINKINELKRREKQNENDLKLTKIDPRLKEEFDDKNKSIEFLTKNIATKKKEIDQINYEITQLKIEVETTQKIIDELFKNQEKTIEQKSFLDKVDVYIKILELYWSELRNRKLSEFEYNITFMYKKLASKNILIDRIEIDPNTYNIKIHQTNGIIPLKSLNSAWEQEIFAISLIWWLAMWSQIEFPIIIDTPLARLDSIHKTNIIEKYFKTASKQVIILSQDGEIAPGDVYYKMISENIYKEISLYFDKDSEETAIFEWYRFIK